MGFDLRRVISLLNYLSKINLAKYSKSLLKLLSASFEILAKTHPGNSLILRWYWIHSQHFPLLEQLV